jgi:hypothetical protein
LTGQELTAERHVFQRVHEPGALSAHLQTKLAHEDSIRSALWSQLGILIAILASAFGIGHLTLTSLEKASSSVATQVLFWTVVILMIIAVGVAAYLAWAMRATFQAVLYSGDTYRRWWLRNYAKRREDPDELKLLGLQERALLLTNLSHAVHTLHVENRERMRGFRVARPAVVVILSLTASAYAAAAVAIRVTGTQEMIGMAENERPTEQDVREIEVPETQIEKGAESAVRDSQNKKG